MPPEEEEKIQSGAWKVYRLTLNSHLCNIGHTTYRKNYSLEKCVGMGLNDFHIKWIIGTHCNWKNQNPGSPFGATS